MFGAHLVWDEGFGEGWTDDDLWGIGAAGRASCCSAPSRTMVRHYRGRIDGWIVANEVTDPEGKHGLPHRRARGTRPIGPEYIAESFHVAHEEDPHALLVINEFGFETVNEFGDRPEPRRRASLQVIDTLLDDGVPLHALGIQGHLLADQFRERFDARGYRRFLASSPTAAWRSSSPRWTCSTTGCPPTAASATAGWPTSTAATSTSRFDEPAVKAVMTFGLSDRYTWLEED